MVRLLVAALLVPLFAFGSQLRVWPEINDASLLVKLAKEKAIVRERYRSPDRKLDVAVLPQKEWSKAVAELNPKEVFIEPGYLLIALMLYPEGMQAIAVIVDETPFKKAEGAWLVENTSDKRIKRVVTRSK